MANDKKPAVPAAPKLDPQVNLVYRVIDKDHVSLQVVAVLPVQKGQRLNVAFANWFAENAEEGETYGTFTNHFKPMRAVLQQRMVPA